MKFQCRRALDQALVRLGERASPALARGLNGAANYLETGRLLHEAGLPLPAPVRTRFEVFDEAIKIARVADQPLYLEFGVWKGDSMRYWSEHLTSEAARFIGFDSFEGLPGDWTHAAGRGTFSTDGRVPSTTDDRVTYVKGWFDETLPSFTVPPHDRLVVNVDSDLYVSGALVLDTLGDRLAVGDMLYFDEFHDRLHEGKAFHEFRIASGHRYRVLAATRGASQILFQRC